MSIAELITSIANKVKGIKDNVRYAYDWINNRIKGNEELGIPQKYLPMPARLEYLVENLQVLNDRKITTGDNIDVPDGVSLARLICDNTFTGENIKNNTTIFGEITELIDDNTWEVCVKRIPFNGIKRLKLGCRIIRSANNQCLYYGYISSSKLEEVEFPNLELLENTESGNVSSHARFIVGTSIKKLYLPKLKGFTRFGMYYLGIAGSCPLLEEIDLPSFVGGTMNPGNQAGAGFRDNPELRIIKLNGLQNGDLKNCFNGSPKLIHFEIRDGFNAALDISAAYGTGWSPTMALRTDTDAEDYVDLREDKTMANNLEQFLWNFQHYIADRVADRTGTSALTMTLTSAVYAALEAQEGRTILATLANKKWNVKQA